MSQDESYRSLFEKTELGVVYHDKQGAIIDVNPAACRILGFRKEKLLQKSSLNYDWQGITEAGSLYPGEEHPAILALKSGKTIGKKIMGIIPRGSTERTWLEIDAVPLFNPEEKQPFQVIVTFKDITEKQMVKMDLLEMEKRYTALFQNSPIGVAFHEMVYDKKGNPVDYYFLDANQNYLTLTGIDPRGKNVTEAFPGIEKDPGDWIGTFYSCIRDNKTIRFQQYLAPNDRWYDVVAYQSGPDQFVAAFIEITEQKKKELELQRLKEELEEKVRQRTAELENEKNKAESANKAKSIFLANMSHELRTPLNAVLGYADILHALETEQKKKQYLKTIVSSGNVLLQLINDVLDLSKIEAGKFELEYSPCSIRQIIEDISSLFRKTLADKNLKFSINIENEIPDFVLLDETRTRQILLNLIGNAVKFTTEGEISLYCGEWKKEKRTDGEMHIFLDVKDTGKGIAPDEHERIFEAFTQAKNQRINEYGGTGLGLAVSRDFARRMGGDILLESDLELGSTFRLLLRNVECLSTHAIENLSRNNQVEMASYVFLPAKLLICDDIDYNRDLIAAYLENQPFKLFFAANGEEALQQVEKNKPDFIFLDMKMPVMDGYSFAEKIRENKKFKSIPIVAVTASSLKEETKNILKQCNKLLRKPVSKREVIHALADYLPYEKKNKEQEREELSLEDRYDNGLTRITEDFRSFLDEGDMDKICSQAVNLKEETPQYTLFADALYAAAQACDEATISRLLEKAGS